MTVNILNYSIDTSLEKLNTERNNKIIVNTINPHSYCEAQKDETFHLALQNSDVLIPDGIGIVLAARFLANRKIKKIAGADLHQFCLKQANLNGKKVFYLGASQQTLNKIKDRLKNDFPAVKVGSYSPPYKQSFSKEDTDAMIAAVNSFKPDYLFVGMTAPKQEKWVYEHSKYLDASIICSIGAVFDFYAGTIKRPNKFWISLGLEWFVRFINEPKRLFKRNFISTPKFLMTILKAKFIRKKV